MQPRRFGVQFEHVAQNCDAAAAMGRFTQRKDLECGSNRSGTGVVALVDQRERAVRTGDTLLFAAPGRCTHPGERGGGVLYVGAEGIDRKRVVSGKMVYVRVDLSGRRILKKQIDNVLQQ